MSLHTTIQYCERQTTDKMKQKVKALVINNIKKSTGQQLRHKQKNISNFTECTYVARHQHATEQGWGHPHEMFPYAKLGLPEYTAFSYKQNYKKIYINKHVKTNI